MRIPASYSRVVRRRHSSEKGATPRITDITLTRTPAVSGCRQRKCTAWPRKRYFDSNGGTAIGSAFNRSRATANWCKLSASDKTAISVSRLNSAPP